MSLDLSGMFLSRLLFIFHSPRNRVDHFHSFILMYRKENPMISPSQEAINHSVSALVMAF
jgi:hypothetical protein